MITGERFSSATDAAMPMTPWVDIGIGPVVGMARRALSLSPMAFSSEQVFLGSYGLKMSGVHAMSNSAKVIQVQSGWDFKLGQPVRNPMGVVVVEAAIPIGLDCPSPEPACRSLLYTSPERSLKATDNSQSNRRIEFFSFSPAAVVRSAHAAGKGGIRALSDVASGIIHVFHYTLFSRLRMSQE